MKGLFFHTASQWNMWKDFSLWSGHFLVRGNIERTNAYVNEILVKILVVNCKKHEQI